MKFYNAKLNPVTFKLFNTIGFDVTLFSGVSIDVKLFLAGIYEQISAYECISKYFIALFPQFIYVIEVTSLPMASLTPVSSMASQNSKCEGNNSVTGNKNKSKVFLAQVSTCSLVGCLTKSEMLDLALLVGHIREQH